MAELTHRGQGDSGISPKGLAIFVSVLAVFFLVADGYRWLALHKELSFSSLFMPVVAINLWSGVPLGGEARRRLTMPWFVTLTVYYLVMAGLALVSSNWLFLGLSIVLLGATCFRLYSDYRQMQPPHAAR